MSPGPPPPPRLLRDVREGYPRLSGSGGRRQLRPLAGRDGSGPVGQARWQDLALPAAYRTRTGGWGIAAHGLERARAPATLGPRRRAPDRVGPSTRWRLRRPRAVRAPGRVGRPSVRSAHARARGGPTKNSWSRLYLVRRIPARPRAPRPAPRRAALNGDGRGDRGEPTPLSAARAAAWARPSARFSNIACVNHAPRVRQRRAASGPAPPTPSL